jgi:membrane-bound serine protease (ClpP class)
MSVKACAKAGAAAVAAVTVAIALSLLAATQSDAKTPAVKPVSPGAPQVDILTLEGAIQPISAEVVRAAIDRAERARREALIIRLDTPGGLDTSMRDIIKRILISEVPVVVYVSPSGGRAASAGTFIAMAAHVAAMAPGTSIGAATPVHLGGGDVGKDMARKIRNDAVSYIRSLASQRGRNADWAEQAVREGSSLGEGDALRLKVVDLVARNVEELLEKLDGRKVTVAGITRTLHTLGAEQHEVAATWRQKLLGRIIDPNIAYILFILGFYGLLFELSSPGAVLPGVVGGICLLLAFLAFQALPVNLTGLFLIIFAMVLFAVDVKAQSHGVLTLGGVVALSLGSLILLGGESGVARISLSLIITVVVATVAFFVFVVGAAYRAHRRRPVTGVQGLLGARGTALTDLGPSGQVFVHGEYWTAESEEPITKGSPVVVDRVEGLTLRVKKA